LYSDGRYYPATISAANDDATYNVVYETGDMEPAVGTCFVLCASFLCFFIYLKFEFFLKMGIQFIAQSVVIEKIKLAQTQ
jgi:hypothetical protein